MTVRRLIIAVGAVLLLAGLIGLLIPVSVSDGNGGSISCGNGIASDLSAAKAANEKNGGNIPILNQLVPHTDFVAQCESSVSSRRAWSIPLTLVGVVALAAPLVARRTRSAPTG
ncbi:MAG: aminopeptidase [Mycobacterium sp.]|uniref:aminopeptidase n=1 Tax=Mycobacterium sp. TaxID=1785 RepID=UPI001EC2A5B6|nr:aminopeptidase [Mycobacterium sp.]MBW0020221.1 aminopeptidase [Mycobacterium sp.]